MTIPVKTTTATTAALRCAPGVAFFVAAEGPLGLALLRVVDTFLHGSMGKSQHRPSTGDRGARGYGTYLVGG